MSCYYRFVKAIAVFLSHLIFRVKVYGKENIPSDKGVVLCCNHTSITDIILLIAFCNRQIFFMAKKDVFKNPLIGGLIRKSGAFPVDRKSSDKGAVQNAISVCQNKGILGIFPEGTRNRDGAPKKAKPGAALIAMQTGADILPVCIYRDNAKVRLFQKAVLRFGKPIAFKDYAEGFDGKVSKNALKNISELIMNNITSLWEKKY